MIAKYQYFPLKTSKFQLKYFSGESIFQLKA